MSDVTYAPEHVLPGQPEGGDGDTGDTVDGRGDGWADRHSDDAPVTPHHGVDQDAVDGEPDADAQDLDGREPLDAAAIPDDAGVDEWFEEMARTDPEAAATVRQSWGRDAGVNLAFAAKTFDTFGTEELGTLFNDAWIVDGNGEALSIGTHPAVIDFLARVGRMVAREPGNPRSIVDNSRVERTRGKDSVHHRTRKQPGDGSGQRPPAWPFFASFCGHGVDTRSTPGNKQLLFLREPYFRG